jgi:hypothetical protein
MAVKKTAKKPAKKPAGKGRQTGVNRFVVDLGQIELPAAAAQQLETDIRRAALAAVAGLDFKGDLRVGTNLAALAGPTRGIRFTIAAQSLSTLKR